MQNIKIEKHDNLWSVDFVDAPTAEMKVYDSDLLTAMTNFAGLCGDKIEDLRSQLYCAEVLSEPLPEGYSGSRKEFYDAKSNLPEGYEMVMDYSEIKTPDCKLWEANNWPHSKWDSVYGTSFDNEIVYCRPISNNSQEKAWAKKNMPPGYELESTFEWTHVYLRHSDI
jgi:hypothetical protein